MESSVDSIIPYCSQQYVALSVRTNCRFWQACQKWTDLSENGKVSNNMSVEFDNFTEYLSMATLIHMRSTFYSDNMFIASLYTFWS